MSDKMIRVSLDSTGLPVPEHNRVKVSKDKQKAKWCADFPFAIEIEGSSAAQSEAGGSDCRHSVHAGPFGEPVGTIIKYSIIANGKTNDPELEIQP